MRVFSGLRYGFVLLSCLCLAGVGFGQPFGQGNGKAGMGGAGSPFEGFRQQQQEKTKAFLETEAKEGQEFMASLAGKPKPEKIESIRKFKTLQYGKNGEFRQTMYQDRKKFIEDRTAANSKFPAAMKEKMTARMEADYQETTRFFESKHQENMAFLDSVLANTALDGKALDDALTTFFQSQKSSAQQYMQQKKARMGKPGEGQGN